MPQRVRLLSLRDGRDFFEEREESGEKGEQERESEEYQNRC
jgi:hypothetical protein